MDTGRYCYDYPRPAVSADCVVFGFDRTDINVLLIQRGNEPFKGKWAFPGGFMEMHENAEECAKRELMEETGIKIDFIEQLHAFSNVDRDPRGRVVTIAFLILVRISECRLSAGDDAAHAAWFKIGNVPQLAFDHDLVLKTALERLREKIRRQPACFDMMDEKFTMAHLRQLYESILEVTIDRRKFRNRIMKTGLLIEHKEKVKDGLRVRHYYRFDRKKFEKSFTIWDLRVTI